TKGESAKRSRSGHLKYTVIGRFVCIKSAGVKSEPLKHRTTVSVRSGLMLAVSVPQADNKNLSVKFASAKPTSRNCVASIGESSCSRLAAPFNPSLEIGRASC